jgi:hypothetical protein
VWCPRDDMGGSDDAAIDDPVAAIPIRAVNLIAHYEVTGITAAAVNPSAANEVMGEVAVANDVAARYAETGVHDHCS